jgi:hypothetical protein
MDNEKLLKERNEKLARWSGFTKCDTLPDAWWYPAHGAVTEELPDFEKVDECIKWLLPKIKRLVVVIIYPWRNSYRYEIKINGFHGTIEGDTLAEAIETYIDWEKEIANGK